MPPLRSRSRCVDIMFGAFYVLLGAYTVLCVYLIGKKRRMVEQTPIVISSGGDGESMTSPPPLSKTAKARVIEVMPLMTDNQRAFAGNNGGSI